MREKSQIEDMRAAVRGDIERARARREADPWRTPEPEPEAEPEAENAEPAASEGQTPEGSFPAETIEEPEAVEVAEAAEPEPEPEPDPAVVDEPEPEPEPKRPGFFARLFGRG
jgi:hypothetical protein